ncbi:MAG: electron transfer flavoprotein subunit alpha [Planctomycetes bacterium]|nr:electron transfer flavoprotein subunit alpha [Planctomycetota bacterium]
MNPASNNGLRTIVCLKVVPRPEEVRVDAETMTLDRAGAQSFINPPDLNALETALKLKDACGGEVSILSMGPPFFEPYLRLALAVGADRAFLLSDRAFGGADTLATTYTLAKGVEKIGAFDLVLCGEESLDGATAQVPPGLAEWLDVAQVTCALEIEKVPGKREMRVQRELKGGSETLSVDLPAVVSVKANVNEPRFIDYDRMEWALQEAPVGVWGAGDLATDPELTGLAGSPTTVAGVRQVATPDRRRKHLSGSAGEIARALADLLRTQTGSRGG